MKKIIIPVIIAILAGALVFVIIYFGGASKRFTIPGKSAHETEIKNLGFQVSEFDTKLFAFIGVQPYTDIKAVVSTTDPKQNKNMDINYVFRDMNSREDALKMFSDLYSNASMLKRAGNKGVSGKIKQYYDKKKNRGYVLYDFTMTNDLLVDNFIMLENSGNLLSEKTRVNYLYGGLYIDDTRMVSITTTEKNKSYDISRTLENLGLPRP